MTENHTIQTKARRNYELEKYITTKRFCSSCGNLMVSVRLPDRTARFSCQACGVVVFSRIKTRRKEEMTIYVPEGQVILDAC